MKNEDIIQQVADFYNVTTENLMHGDRRRSFSEPRHVAMYLLREMCGMTHADIGRLFNKRHPVSSYATHKVTEWVINPRLNRKAAECVQTILWNNNDTKK